MPGLDVAHPAHVYIALLLPRQIVIMRANGDPGRHHVVPTGIAIGAHYDYLPWQQQSNVNMRWMGNIEARHFSALFESVRQRAHQQLREHAREQGNGVLAHLNFSQMFEVEIPWKGKRYLARHIVVATT